MGDRLVVPSDIARMLLIASADCVSRVVPLRADAAFCAAVLKPVMLMVPHRVSRSRQRMRELLGSSIDGEQLEGHLHEHYRMRAESAWSRIRLLRGDEWSGRITLRGREHLERARQRGKGTIIWRFGFCDALIGHAACANAGFPLTHLSHYQHGGWTQTRLALNRIAPMYYKGEERLVKERVVMGPSRSLGYLRTLESRLASNEVVSIIGENSAPHAIAVPFFGRTVRLAPGAPGLAWRTDAALLTMRAIRTGPYRYEVIASEPMVVDRRQSRREWVESAVADFAIQLVQNVRDHPASWLGWSASRILYWRDRFQERG